MNITAERAEVLAFTQNYIPPANSAYMALDAGVDVTTGVIAAQTGTVQAAHVAESGATLVEYATPDETVAAVRNGEADAVFADKDYLMPILEESGGQFAWAGEEVQIGDGVGMGLRQSDTELRDKFDAGISAMKADGSLNALIVKWFGDKVATF